MKYYVVGYLLPLFLCFFLRSGSHYTSRVAIWPRGSIELQWCFLMKTHPWSELISRRQRLTLLEKEWQSIWAIQTTTSAQWQPWQPILFREEPFQAPFSCWLMADLHERCLWHGLKHFSLRQDWTQLTTPVTALGLVLLQLLQHLEWRTPWSRHLEDGKVLLIYYMFVYLGNA